MGNGSVQFGGIKKLMDVLKTTLASKIMSKQLFQRTNIFYFLLCIPVLIVPDPLAGIAGFEPERLKLNPEAALVLAVVPTRADVA